MFEKVDDAVRILANLRREPGMRNAGVLDLFDQDSRSVTSVTFHNLIQRTALMLNLSELAEGSVLRSNVDELTRYRNKVVHFSIEMNINQVASLLSDILDPLLDLLSREIHDTKFVSNCIPEIRKRAQPVRNISFAYEQESIQRLLRLVRRFKGQHVKGELFSLENEIVLPDFSAVVETGPQDKGVDIKADSPTENWFIEVKTRFVPSYRDRILERLERFVVTQPNAKIWLVIMGDVPNIHKAKIKERGFMLSTLDDIVTLEQIL